MLAITGKNSVVSTRSRPCSLFAQGVKKAVLVSSVASIVTGYVFEPKQWTSLSQMVAGSVILCTKFGIFGLAHVGTL